MKKQNIIILIVIALSISAISCNKIKDKTKNSINKSGETIGKSTTEFIEGVGDGITKTLALDIKVSEDLISKGLETGKYLIETSETGSKNILTLYIIFNKDFDETVFLKAYDKNNLEIGRVNIKISGKKDEAGYYDFVFDERTKLENKGSLILE